MRVIVISLLRTGLPVSAAGFLAAALLLTRTDLPDALLPAIAALPLLTGALLSGCDAARIRRRGGLLTGLCTALLLTAVWFAAGCVLRGRLCVPAVLPAAILCGGAGGICGVNLDAPLPRKRLRMLRFLCIRGKMLPLMLHRPKNIDSGQQ